MFPENHEEDVALYMSSVGGITFNKVPPIKEIKSVQEIEMPYNLLASGVVISRAKSYQRRFLINKEKRTLFLEYYSTKVVVKCHEEDEFDWKIGLGLALSNANAINERKSKWHRDKWFRTKENHKLDYKAYSNWVLVEYYKNDMEDLCNLEQRVNNAKDKEFINL